MVEQKFPERNGFNQYIAMYISLAGKAEISVYFPPQFDHLLRNPSNFSKYFFSWLLLNLWLRQKYYFKMNLLPL